VPRDLALVEALGGSRLNPLTACQEWRLFDGLFEENSVWNVEERGRVAHPFEGSHVPKARRKHLFAREKAARGAVDPVHGRRKIVGGASAVEVVLIAQRPFPPPQLTWHTRRRGKLTQHLSGVSNG
jgi:hypothetical protein